MADGSGYRSSYPLLAALIAILGLSPFGARAGAGEWVFDLLLSGVILSAVWATRDRQMLLWGAALGLPALFFTWFGLYLEQTAVAATGLAFGLATMLFVAGLGLRDVVQARRVTVSSIAGGVCGYLLLGIAWAYVFALLEAFDRGSFLRQGQMLEGDERGLRSVLYYAFVTLTTLGYGDVVPATEPAEGFSVLAAISGQLYLAVLIAALISRFVADRSPD